MALALKVPVGKTTSRVGEAEASRAVGVLREPTPRGIDWAQIRAELVENRAKNGAKNGRKRVENKGAERAVEGETR